ncbi:MAG: SDR family oxidoreductase [Candidatus Margulisiibacteriota bacterium]|nr:SDR family oxidoreductase [Candidatus Margulisiibacteriota bacterium]
MSKSILITGSSSGIGCATARLFEARAWNVAASMRKPSGDFSFSPPLDVTDPKSIKEAVQATVNKFGGIDVLVNNAGYALEGLFESSSKEQVVKQFETNLFGLIEVTREVLPVMRRQKKGIIINVSSMGGRVGFPLYSLYNSTKFAVEGFSEAVHYELEAVGIKVKLIEPGVIKTDFYGRSMDKNEKQYPEDYKDFISRTRADLIEGGGKFSTPDEVALVIYKAATDGSSKLRYPAGPDARQLAFLKRFLPDNAIFHIIRSVTLNNKAR